MGWGEDGVKGEEGKGKGTEKRKGKGMLMGTGTFDGLHVSQLSKDMKL